MCGIIGVICQEGEACFCVHDGLEQLQNRGYDSVGVLYVEEGVTKVDRQIRTGQSALAKLRRPGAVDDLCWPYKVGYSRSKDHRECSPPYGQPGVSCCSA